VHATVNVSRFEGGGVCVQTCISCMRLTISPTMVFTGTLPREPSASRSLKMMRSLRTTDSTDLFEAGASASATMAHANCKASGMTALQ
jgi:hypothetical protein